LAANPRLLLLLLCVPALIGGLGPRMQFDDRVLAAHNRERTSAGLRPLAWDAALAEDAAGWADQLARTDRFEHSPDAPDAEPQGENLWAGTPRWFQPEAMVGLWIAEKQAYRPGVFPNNSRSGRVEDVSHYTQVMWRSSIAVGCSLREGRKEEVLVCRYRSAGNVVGEIPF
jgi:hypothetical protein